MDELFVFIVGLIVAFLVGCLWGLIPYFLGRSRNRPNLGRWGLLCTGFSGIFGVALIVVIGFVIAILASNRDVRPLRLSAEEQPAPSRPTPPPVVPPRAGLNLVCLAGPLRGQTYRIGPSGLMFGRDSDCTVRFPAETKGISRHHCILRWQQNVLVLVDLDSAYGTFLGDGRQLPPNYPTAITPGTRFYLGSTGVLFQISAT